MKKMIFILLTGFLLFGKTITTGIGDRTSFEIIQNTDMSFEFILEIPEIELEKIMTEEGYFTKLNVAGFKFTKEAGLPELPLYRELIQSPFGSRSSVTIVEYEETDIDIDDHFKGVKVFPAQPSYSKSTPESEIEFIYKPENYQRKGFMNSEVIKLMKSGSMRGVDITALEFMPFDYDPSENIIRVMKRVRIRIDFNDPDPDYINVRKESYSPFFDKHFKDMINYRPRQVKEDLSAYPITYLIVANEALTGNAKLQEFIDWKTEKGFNVIPKFFSSSVTTATVDDWIERQYASISPKPTFLLIVGDEAGSYIVPAEQNPAIGSTGSVSVSDLMYSVIGTTSDSNRIPSMYCGRFSVGSLDDLNAQIDKTIWYEKTQFTSGADLTYLSNVMGVAGVDGSYATTHGNPHIKYGMTYYFNNDYRIPVDGTGVNINGINYYYPASSYSGVNTEVIDYVKNGVAFYNYTAHGSTTSFSNPSFSITNVNTLGNTGEYPLVIGNCCLTGSFGEYSDCFGEAWLKAADQGSVGFIGASMSTYWDEDLAMGVGEAATGDTIPPYSPNIPGMYDALMQMEHRTQAGVRHAGLMAVENLGGSMVSSYWSAYHLLGDPSLMTYMGIPGDNTVTHDAEISPGVSYFSVQALPGSYVALSDADGVLHGAGIAGGDGYAVVTIEPFLSGSARIVVTSQFKKPYFADIPVGEFTGPYLLVNDTQVSTTQYGASGTADIELKNIGISTSGGILINASTLSEYLTFTDNSENYGNIADGDSLKIPACISYNISPDTPDGENIRVVIEINDSSKATYYGYFVIAVNSPDLNITHNGANEVIKPGDTRDITFRISNNGSASLNDATAEITQITAYDIDISGAQNITSINEGTYTDLSFNLSFGNQIPEVVNSEFVFSLTDNKGLSKEYDFTLTVGMTEDFETGDFSSNSWTQGSYGWVIESAPSRVFSGQYCMVSDTTITDNQSAVIEVEKEFIVDGSVSFYRRVSSEATYDFLKFYIDDVEKSSWDGEKNWADFSYPVSAGVHTLKWAYQKDYSESGGYDRAWIDNLLLFGVELGIEEIANIPSELTLYQNYPNPFNPETSIEFSIPKKEKVSLSIYNSGGQLVSKLIDSDLAKGFHKVSFDASGLNSGTYFYTLTTSAEQRTRKMLLIK